MYCSASFQIPGKRAKREVLAGQLPARSEKTKCTCESVGRYVSELHHWRTRKYVSHQQHPLQGLFEEVPESAFREDISSTQLREQGRKGLPSP